MENQPTDTLTSKGKQTRQHILDTAIALFVEKGYEATTMRDIAAAADCSLGLAYRYFARKEELVLALYKNFSEESEQYIYQMPGAPLADRFYQAMEYKFGQLRPYREMMGAMFGAMMNPNSGVAILGSSTGDIRDRSLDAFKLIVTGAKDAPREPAATHLATLFYSGHLLMILFWLYDRTPEQRATYELLRVTRDTLRLVRPALVLPPIARTLARLASILEPVFAGGIK